MLDILSKMQNCVESYNLKSKELNQGRTDKDIDRMILEETNLSPEECIGIDSNIETEDRIPLPENSNQVNTSNREEEDPNMLNSQPEPQQDHDAVVIPHNLSEGTQEFFITSH